MSGEVSRRGAVAAVKQSDTITLAVCIMSFPVRTSSRAEKVPCVASTTAPSTSMVPFFQALREKRSRLSTASMPLPGPASVSRRGSPAICTASASRIADAARETALHTRESVTTRARADAVAMESAGDRHEARNKRWSRTSGMLPVTALVETGTAGALSAMVATSSITASWVWCAGALVWRATGAAAAGLFSAVRNEKPPMLVRDKGSGEAAGICDALRAVRNMLSTMPEQIPSISSLGSEMRLPREICGLAMEEWWSPE
mmetsp:Transcript_2113/g.5023  ORF Transcript_2113/g.5023 Transcript_2113/m.5023 type:complete len:260 (+) Transcript_2113:500-1279(+)